jgi:hypothetical protein
MPDRSGSARPIARYLTTVLLWALAISTIGCQAEPMRVLLTTYDNTGEPVVHYADFQHAAYHRNAEGLLHIALYGSQPSSLDPTQMIQQVVYIREIWNPRPGKTFANQSQINTVVQYAILTPPTGVRYDGTAFVMCDGGEDGDDLEGEIESGNLSPSARMGEVGMPFGHARIEGWIEAEENEAAVMQAIQQMESLFKTPAQSVSQ